VIICRTNRLIFRTWEPDDIDAFISLFEKPGLTDFASDTYKNLTPEKARAFIEKETERFQSTGSGKFAVCSAEDSSLLGISGIFEMDAPLAGFEINYRFPSETWGKGVGSEAAQAMINYGFNTLDLKTVYAIILTTNIRSRRVLEKAGMSMDKNLFWKDLPAELWSVSR
jgi:ribosomal-protein-alanine N-acetyltransferase